ncbi:prolyl oligopeptidase family serine peptidase [Georgenia satyanarayanai]|uniref:alpha/beta hydrolase family protein n=1 Tax=Georgenia satyanarayanai TaxID=860221 RepID=UPI00203BE806|nr:prolyl oligopeptidase family serine peptidase [Georgenia satyanarayanai]MCM3659621.1 prolyl oligopeptidase family serine peptidase [Georgenia satyanarayanai]
MRSWRVAVTVVAVLLFGLIGTVAGPGWHPQPLDQTLVVQTPDVAIGGDVATDPLGTYETRTETFTVELDGATVRATVHEPVGAPGLRPGLVFMHGAGTATHDNFWQISEALASAGVVAMVPDKRMDTYSARYRDYPAMAEDYMHSFRELAARPGVDPDRVGFYAESEGAFVAPVAAAEHPEVAHLVLVSAPVVPAREQFALATDTYLRNLGAPEQLLRAVPRLLGSEIPGGGFVYADFDVSPYQQRTDQPVLMVYGTQDVSMPVVQAPAKVVADLARTGNDGYTVRYFEGANHGIRIDGELAPGFPEVLARWVQGLPETADAQPRIAGGQPDQRFRAEPVDSPRWYASGDMIVLTLVGPLVLLALGPVLWLLTRLVRRPSEPLPSPLARTTAALAMGVLAVWTLFVSYLLVVADLALNYETNDFAVQGGWLGVQAVAIGTTAVGVWSATTWLRVRRGGVRTGTVGTITLVGVHLGALVLLLAAGYWGVFPTVW